MKKELVLFSEEDSFVLGRKIASSLPMGGFVALYGDLGSGKTVIARGIADYLGIINIQSPTFTILQKYNTNPVLYHIDAYRLTCEDELYDIGYEDCFIENALVVIEWADIVPQALPLERIDVHIYGSGSEPRRICIEYPDNLLLKNVE